MWVDSWRAGRDTARKVSNLLCTQCNKLLFFSIVFICLDICSSAFLSFSSHLIVCFYVFPKHFLSGELTKDILLKTFLIVSCLFGWLLGTLINNHSSFPTLSFLGRLQSTENCSAVGKAVTLRPRQEFRPTQHGDPIGSQREIARSLSFSIHHFTL